MRVKTVNFAIVEEDVSRAVTRHNTPISSVTEPGLRRRGIYLNNVVKINVRAILNNKVVRTHRNRVGNYSSRRCCRRLILVVNGVAREYAVVSVEIVGVVDKEEAVVGIALVS